MSRKKPATIVPIQNLAEADAVLGEIAAAKRQLQTLETVMNETIDAAKAQAQAKAAPLQSRIASLENGLLAFAAYNKHDVFAVKRTQKMKHGAMGFRRSSDIRPAKKTTWKMVLNKLQELRLTQAIRVREDVNREELRSWPDERLELIGARRVEKDAFWYELDESLLTEDSARAS